MPHQAVAAHLQGLHQQDQQEHGDHHHVGLEALVTEADRQVAQPATADHPGHGGVVEALPLARHDAVLGARVLQVLPGGVLQVQGAREVRVNEETQYMVISGLVRAQDVASDNSIDSTQLADSKVEYYGKGQLADMQRQGWLTRLLNNIWPF